MDKGNVLIIYQLEIWLETAGEKPELAIGTFNNSNT
jgi:hypothetical protein